MWRGVLLVASLAAFAARAEGGFSPVVAELCVNKVICVSPILWQAADQTFFAEEETLKELRIQFPKTGVVAEGRTLYPLSALPGAALHFNEDRQRLELTVEPTAFETFQASMDQRTMPPVSSGRGAFLNYDLSMGRTVAWYSAGLFDLGVHGGTSSFRSSVVLEATDELVKGTRLETCFVHDDPEAMRRVRIGDSISDAATWGGALRFAGLQVSRNFTMQPWLVTAPLVGATNRFAGRRVLGAGRSRSPTPVADRTQSVALWGIGVMIFLVLVGFFSPALEDPLFPPLVFAVIGLGWVLVTHGTRSDDGTTAPAGNPVTDGNPARDANHSEPPRPAGLGVDDLGSHRQDPRRSA